MARIAAALERLAPAHEADTDWAAAPAYYWDGSTARTLPAIEALPLVLLTGIDAQKAALHGNVARHAQGRPAHDVLLWGARGMGKSALVKAAVAAVRCDGADLSLVQASAAHISTLPALFAALAAVERRFVLFIDDIGFEEPGAARALRSLLEGGVAARPGNVRLCVTSNRRHIVERPAEELEIARHPRDSQDDQLALADRFGLSLGFHACSQEEYLAIVAGYAGHFGLAVNPDEALFWARQRGNRSGRVAWQFVQEVAGRMGHGLSNDRTPSS